ncbi:high affinity copper uptake protein 1-like [Plodia interpunctella]|uniref:high affinity copper uptake protein 1-like n=1 Tax=Plodia interpunctella TaxID=58824 RepID=UPI0023680BB4|nr:high affinity copper uptake protein 1-like [Plodia interpunctella]XP_053601108.1 high affinity copper uptake protein 1-like [Plodia interpunctella]
MDHLHNMDHSNHEGMQHMHHNNMDHDTHKMNFDMNFINNTADDISSMGQSSDVLRQGEHGSHVSHGGHDIHTSTHHMSMTFHGGCQEVILFSWWDVDEVGEFVGSFFAIFIMALLYEGLKYYRKHLLWKTYTGLQYCAVSSPDKRAGNICAADEPQVIQPVPHALERNVPSMLSAPHAWQTVLHGLQVLVSYMLMLVFMTYNTWLCAAVVLGSATGYFLFGWRESVVVDFTEHCH